MSERANVVMPESRHHPSVVSDIGTLLNSRVSARLTSAAADRRGRIKIEHQPSLVVEIDMIKNDRPQRFDPQMAAKRRRAYPLIRSRLAVLHDLKGVRFLRIGRYQPDDPPFPSCCISTAVGDPSASYAIPFK